MRCARSSSHGRRWLRHWAASGQQEEPQSEPGLRWWGGPARGKACRCTDTGAWGETASTQSRFNAGVCASYCNVSPSLTAFKRTRRGALSVWETLVCLHLLCCVLGGEGASMQCVALHFASAVDICCWLCLTKCRVTGVCQCSVNNV